MKLPKFNLIPWWVKLAVPVGAILLIVVIIANWWSHVKTNITHSHPDYITIVKSDSTLRADKTQLLAKQSQLIAERSRSDSTISAYKTREAQHQKNNYELSKQLNTYRRENRVCFKTNFWGKTEEVPCSEVFK